MAPNKSSIDSVIAEYIDALKSIKGLDAENIEIEAKIQSLNAKTFNASLKSMAAKATFAGISCSINRISNKSDTNGRNYSFIDCRLYDGNKAIGKKVSTKKNIGMKYNASGEFMKYALAVARETEITDPNVITNNVMFDALCRFKLRVSFVFPDNPEWQYDYTISHQLPPYGMSTGDISRLRSELFAGIKSTMNVSEVLPIFIERALLPIVNHEIEVERIVQDHSGSISAIRGDLEKALMALWKTFDADFTEGDQRVTLIREIYELISKNTIQKKLTLKNILNAAKSLTKSDYYQDVYPPLGWFITDKADGERCVVYVNGSNVNVIYSDIETMTATSANPKTIVDCELITALDGKRMLGIFDVLYCNDRNLTEMFIEERMSHAKAALAVIREPLAGLGIEAYIKDYVQIGQPIEESVLKVFNTKRPYKTDGLILTSQTGDYYKTNNYKWKPTEENTIDFMVIRCPKTLLGFKEKAIRPGYTLYVLMNGLNDIRRRQYGISLWDSYTDDTGIEKNKPYIPVLFQSVLWPYAYLYYHKDPVGDSKEEAVDLHGQVCEFSVNPAAADTLKSAFSKGTVDSNLDLWHLNRIRHDRSVALGEYGNDFVIAEQIFSNVIDPFALEDLWLGNSSYFEKTRDLMYKAPNKFKRFVIKRAFETYLHAGQTVLDVAAGRGADIAPYMISGISRLVAIDIDPTALMELIRRSMDQSILNLRKGSPMKLNVLVSDVSGNPNVNKRAVIDRFAVSSVNVIVCNFAFHYFCVNSTACSNALSFISDMASPTEDTYFIMTVMDGASVFKLLEPIDTGKSWSVSENSLEKYLIRKDYDSAELSPFGQKVSVKLPMTTKLYTEPLCNIGAVAEVAAKYGFKMEAQRSFGEYLSNFISAEPAVAKALTYDDINYCKLHSIVIFKKPGKPTKTGGFKKFAKKD